MGSGKHSSSWRDKKNSFDDSKDYSSYLENRNKKSNETNNYNEENNKVSEKEENLDKKVDISNLEEENVTFSETKFWDEDEEEIEKSETKKKILIVIVIVIILAIIAGVIVYKYIQNNADNEETEVIETVEEPETMISTYQGYDVLGKIKIESLEIEQYILDSTEETALENGVGRIDNGASINNYGNFCIAGHNIEGIFERLNELAVGDEIILIEPDYEETVYQITNIYEVEPDNLECLLQDEEKIELTLVTCENGATTRLIIRAEEQESLLENANNTEENVEQDLTDTDNNTVNTEVEEDV